MDDGKTPNITIEQLQAMAIVLQRGSPAAAARRLGRSKNFVLGAVNAIESRMGTRLVDRHGTHWQPTQAGHDAAGRLADLLNEFDRFTTAAGAPAHDGIGRLVVTSDLEPGLLPLGAWAGHALGENPLLQIALRSGRVEHDDAGTDVVISDTPVRTDAWSSEVVGSVGFGLFAAPDYLHRHPAPATPADLATHALLNTSGDAHGGDWRLLDTWDSDSRPFTPSNPPVLTTGSLADAREAARAGAGIGLLPLHAAIGDVQAGQLVALLSGWRPPPVPIYCACRPLQSRSARVMAFVERVRRGLADLDRTVKRVMPL